MNQAYEGALKESYKVLASKDIDKETPFEIEQYLLDNNIFKNRVLQLFSNYRKEWRNKSTHDYKLIFDESEAFIALTTVSSFSHLLLKQIQEKVAFQHQIKIQQDKIKEAGKILKEASVTPLEKLADIIENFAKDNSIEIFNGYLINESEIIGLFHGFLKGLTIIDKVEREPSFDIGSHLSVIPDFIVEIDGERIVLDFRRFKSENTDIRNQILTLMQASKCTYGAMYYANFNHSFSEIIKDYTETKIDGKQYNYLEISS